MILYQKNLFPDESRRRSLESNACCRQDCLTLVWFRLWYCSTFGQTLKYCWRPPNPNQLGFPLSPLYSVCLCSGKSRRRESSLSHSFLPPRDIIALAPSRTKYGLRSPANRDPKSRRFSPAATVLC